MRIFIPDPGIILIEEQAGLKLLFGSDFVAAPDCSERPSPCRPALQSKLGLFTSSTARCLSQNICGVGIAPLPLVYIGEQLKSRLSIGKARPDQPFGFCLRFPEPSFGQGRLGFTQIGIEAR